MIFSGFVYLLPFPAEIQDDLRPETNRPTNKSKPAKSFIGDMEWN